MKKALLIATALLAHTLLLAQSQTRTPNRTYTEQPEQWVVLHADSLTAVDGNYIRTVPLRRSFVAVSFLNFGFNIPTDATITTIVARVTRKKTGRNLVRDVVVDLVRNIGGGDFGGWSVNLSSPDPWTEEPLTQVYTFPASGTLADGTPYAWTPAYINDPLFGLMYNSLVGARGRVASVEIDQVEITVNYSEGATVSRQSMGSPGLASIDLKQFGNKLQVTLGEEGRYRLTVRNSAGTILQQTAIHSGKSHLIQLSERAKGYCIITVEGRHGARSIQAFVE